MGRRRKFIPSAESLKYEKVPTVVIDGFTVNRGDIIKVKGEHGIKFKFDYLVTNTETGRVWVDCFEVYKTMSGVYRSFEVERVKRVPQRGKRSKRVV